MQITTESTPRDQWQVSGIYFDTTGWTLHANGPDKMAWTHENSARLTLHKSSQPPTDVTCASLASLRQRGRARAAQEDARIVSDAHEYLISLGDEGFTGMREAATAVVHVVGALTTQCQAMEQMGQLHEAVPILQRVARLQAEMGGSLRSLQELAGGTVSEIRAELKVVR